MTSESFSRDEPATTHSVGAECADIARSLRAALDQAIVRPGNGAIRPAARRTLRPIVRAFAMSCRKRHATPEATLIALKQLIGDVDREVVDSRFIDDDDDEHKLIAEIITWCIEDYYRDD
jgi:hypothetical protein